MKSKLKYAGKLLQNKNSGPDEVIRLLSPVARKKGASWHVFYLIAAALIKKAEYGKAAGYLQKAVDLEPGSATTSLPLSICLFHLHQLEESEKFAVLAVENNDCHFKAWMQLGKVCRARAKLNEALKCYRKANQLDPKSTEVALSIGGIYKDQGMNSKSLELLDIVLKMDPANRRALLEKSKIYQADYQPDQAESCLKVLLDRNENDCEAAIGLAEIYRRRGNYDQTIRLYEDLLERVPKSGEIRSNYANCLKELGLFDQAEQNYLKAFKDRPGLLEPLSNYLMALHYNPDRTKDEIFEAHKMWDRNFAPAEATGRPVPADRSRDRRLRVGFISGGFRCHPVGWMITPGLENLCSEQFELFFYTTNNRIDRITKRLYSLSTCWRPVTGFGNEVIADMIRKDEIDILVDLSGHAAENRLRTIALEPAPVIVKWVGGLFNTTGLGSVDFLVTDHHETPAGSEGYYVEKLVRMPDGYICFLPPPYAPEINSLPAGEEGPVTFGCFNNPSKINQDILETWASILNLVPDSRLFLKSKQYDVERLRERIKDRMGKGGIPEERLIFEGQSKHDELLRCYHRVDIALDPWPYSGGLTTCESLWMGVPVVTLPGPTFAGRHSATHLMNAGYPEWIARDREEYIEKAVEMSEDRSGLAKIRKGLRSQVEMSPLCDGKRFGAHLAKAFREMWKQRTDGYVHGREEWQQHISVELQGDDSEK